MTVDAMHRPALLLVDDDIDALTASSLLLELLGYAVTAVDDPSKALQLLREGRRCDVLLTDVVMPVMNGIQFADAAVALRPGLRVIYLTGFSADLVAGGNRLQGDVIFKPWNVTDLDAAIRRCLPDLQAQG